MGFTRALEMRQFAGEEAALIDHLQSNHFPPVSLAFLPTAQKAIELAREEKFDAVVDLPKGLKERTATVRQVVEAFHLEAFLEELEADHDQEG